MNFNQFNRSISLNQNLANYTWFNVGGNAEILFIPNDIKELFDFLKSRSEKYEIFTIGAGSNILIRDKGIS